MEITITETIKTVSWKEGRENAPAKAISAANEKAESGAAVAFGKTDDALWVVVAYNSDSRPYVAWRENPQDVKTEKA
jgi:hypothetical protein